MEESIVFRGDDELSGSSLISVQDAYVAMFYFVEAYWERGGRAEGSVTLLSHDLGPTKDPQDDSALWTNDPAFWNDWLTAVRLSNEKGLPKDV